MSYFFDFLHNEIIIAAFFSWITAQVLKTAIFFAVHRDFRFERLLGDGGMPSSHSATVVGMAVAVALTCGVGDPLFAVSLILALIVMHDAMGVRLETGKQAVVLNDMIRLFMDMGRPISAEEKLKEFVGHTPLQVFFGAVTGFLVALIVHYIRGSFG
ncbi:MAG: divergent PAP2 family protein [Lachnospiraceae bacterium]|nr:divergent PAP2 family protein [Lachnospiraceae bacterium]